MGGMMSSDYIDKYDQKRKKSGRGTILIIGLDASGKTSVTYRLVGARGPGVGPTSGHNKETVARRGRKWDLFDVGGSLLVRETWKLYAKAADGIIFVIDSCDERRFNEAKMWIRNMYIGEDAGAKPSCPLLVLTNKQEVQGVAIPYKKIEKQLALEELPVRQKIVLPCSANTGENLEVAFNWLIESIGNLTPM